MAWKAGAMGISAYARKILGEDSTFFLLGRRCLFYLFPSIIKSDDFVNEEVIRRDVRSECSDKKG